MTLTSTNRAEGLAVEQAAQIGRSVRLHRKSAGGDQWGLVLIAKPDGTLRRFAW
jgi:hypothetical protein